MLPLIGRIRLENIVLDIEVIPGRQIVITIRAFLDGHKAAGQIVVLDRDHRIVAHVLTDLRGGIQGTEVQGCYRLVVAVNAGERIQHNGAFVPLNVIVVLGHNQFRNLCERIGLILCSSFTGRRCREHRNEAILLAALVEDQGFGLDALAPCKDKFHRHPAHIGHRHGIVEDLELLEELHHQIAILNTVLGYLGSVGGTLGVECKDILGTHIILGLGPADGRRAVFLESGAGIGHPHMEGLGLYSNHFELLADDVVLLIHEHYRAAGNGALC